MSAAATKGARVKWLCDKQPGRLEWARNNFPGIMTTESIDEMLHVAHAEDIKIEREPLPPGWSIHEIGTARMGRDPKTSVTDPSCRLHDVKNVYLADAAPFVCGGTQNTTWSILAMAWRTMDLLKERMRTGEV